MVFSSLAASCRCCAENPLIPAVQISAATSKNYIQEGSIIAVTTPSGGVVSGEGLIVGSLFGVALHSSTEGEALEVATEGVYRLPKASTAVLSVGTRVAWDNTAKNINLPGTGRFLVGIATEAAGNGVTSVAVRLDGVATVAA